jgi:uncharacterized protein YciI
MMLPILMLLATEAGSGYCFGYLNAHPDRKEIPDAEAQEIQKAHLQHLGKMAAAGQLLAAGPLATPGGARGLLVFRCDSAEQARQWAEQDPAVVNLRLAVEIYRWQGTGVWGEPLASKVKADPNYKYSMNRLPFVTLVRGAKYTPGTEVPDELVTRHVEYLKSLAKSGKVRSFGPFDKSPDKLGVAIYSEIPIEEANALVANDPMVKEGWGKPVVHVWFVASEAVPGHPAK